MQSSSSYGNVQKKIKCLFQTSVVDSTSSKRPGQNYSVLATDSLQSDAIASIGTAHASEKIDGTCCFVHEYQEKLCLWARLDRKLNKHSNKRFKEYCRLKQQWLKNDMKVSPPEFTFNYPKDLKPVPDSWIPASGVERHPKEKHILPDANGHIPGWVPICSDTKQYCWHHMVTFDEQQLMLVLKESESRNEKIESSLILSVEPMSNYSETTLELIGTNINANPYGLGTKKLPFHVLVPHGCIALKNLPSQFCIESFRHWFLNRKPGIFNGNVEGIVWHCENGLMFKLHRHHLKLHWPVRPSADEDLDADTTSIPSLCQRKVNVLSHVLQNVDVDLSKLFKFVKEAHLKSFSSLVVLAEELS